MIALMDPSEMGEIVAQYRFVDLGFGRFRYG
jgi:hypothetical protein